MFVMPGARGQTVCCWLIVTVAGWVPPGLPKGQWTVRRWGGERGWGDAMVMAMAMNHIWVEFQHHHRCVRVCDDMAAIILLACHPQLPLSYLALWSPQCFSLTLTVTVQTHTHAHDQLQYSNKICFTSGLHAFVPNQAQSTCRTWTFQAKQSGFHSFYTNSQQHKILIAIQVSAPRLDLTRKKNKNVYRGLYNIKILVLLLHHNRFCSRTIAIDQTATKSAKEASYCGWMGQEQQQLRFVSHVYLTVVWLIYYL